MERKVRSLIYNVSLIVQHKYLINRVTSNFLYREGKGSGTQRQRQGKREGEREERKAQG
jgi:hypothetical protein